MAFPKPPPRDPRDLVKVGWYLKNTKGTRLVWVLSVDAKGAIAECAKSGDLVEIKPPDLMQQWTRVRPAQ